MTGFITLATVLAVILVWAGFRWSVLSRNRTFCGEHGHEWSQQQQSVADPSSYMCARCGKVA